MKYLKSFKLFESLESHSKSVNISDLKGKIIDKILIGDDVITFICDNIVYLMYHVEDCCESVTVDDIVGDINDLIGSEIIRAEESTSNTDEPSEKIEVDDSYTWTYYKIATKKGYVDIKWFGTSNGYYSEVVETFNAVISDIYNPFCELSKLFINKKTNKGELITFDNQSIIDLFYDYDIIQKGEVIVDRLNEFLKDINIDTIVKDVYWEYSDVNKYDFKAVDGELKIII